LDYVLPWIVTLLNRPPRLTENYGYFRDANRPADYHAVRDGGQTRNLNHRGTPQVEMMKLVVPLTDQNADTGTLSVIPGSHLLDMHPPFDLDEADALPDLRILNLAAGQPMIFSENLYHAGYPGADMTQQRRTLFFSYEPSHHADWAATPSDACVARCTPRQQKLLRRAGRWHEDWSEELASIGG
jgi:ectoine hydroxylase-related dioxygenase (phytanoyl-CoA dioxygenase family)